MSASPRQPLHPWLRGALWSAVALPPAVHGALQLAAALPLNSVDTALTALVLCGVVSVLIAGWTFGIASLWRFGVQALVPAALVTIMLLLLHGGG